jgi:hypothetical protein
MALIDRLRAARERDVEIGGFKFRLRRPTGLHIATDAGDPQSMLRKSIVGWTIPECEVVPGGSGEPAAWELDAAMEWLEDRPELYNALIRELNAMIDDFVAKLKETEKKS